MFKKLLTTWALTTTLIGGIGTASAEYCKSEEPQFKNNTWVRYALNYDDNFPSVFTQNYRGKNITWYFRYKVGTCLFDQSGHTVNQAYYEGREN